MKSDLGKSILRFMAKKDGSINLRDVLDRLEVELINRALELEANNKTKAALRLNLNRTTLIEKLKKRAI